jgi:hypothetical protein
LRIGLRSSRDGRFFPILGDRSRLGSREGCDILIDDDGVSPEHAEIRITSLGIEIDDLTGRTSTATLVNSYPIAKHFLSARDELRLGSVSFVLEIGGEEAPGQHRCKRCGVEFGDSSASSGGGSSKPGLCRPCSLRTGSWRLASSPRPSARVESARIRVGGSSSEETPRLVPAAPTRRLTKVLWPEGYEPIGVLGEGSQGQVYKLHNRALNRVVAAKRLWTSGAKAVGRFEREIEAMRRVEHPAIVRLVDVWRRDPSAVLLMEFVDGPSLARMIKSDGRIDARRALKIAAQIAEGLAHAATFKVIHRDVKPSNILVGPRDTAKITDFGLVAFEDTRTKLTADGQWIGTPHYMAPEQVTGDEVDGRTDVWGLGATFYQAITGMLPFNASAPSEFFKKILTAPIDMGSLARLAGEPVANLFEQLLSKRRDTRPTPAEAARALREIAGQ